MAINKKKLIIAGGGTGGHVAAGIALAESFKKKFPDGKVLFVGASGGMEEKMVPRVGFPLELLSIGQLKGISLFRKLKTLLKLPIALIRSAKILITERPSSVIGVGGYASGPLVMTARILYPILRSRTAILEQNAIPGLTNRILSHFAQTIFLAFPVADGVFPKSKMVVTGNPVRSNLDPLPASSQVPFTIFVFGGSQGALGVNSLVIDALPHLKSIHTQLRWVHQTGEKDYDRVREAHDKNQSIARVEKFIFDMKSAYSDASLLICRSGSSTLSEIAQVGRASILVPFPQAADDHQTKNAENFSRLTGAIVMKQAQTQGKELATTIQTLIQNPERIKKMELAALNARMPGAADQILEILV